MYGCLPSQLEEEPWDVVAEHLAMVGAEGRVAEHRRKAANARARPRRR